jgi:hypothetical protein
MTSRAVASSTATSKGATHEGSGFSKANVQKL